MSFDPVAGQGSGRGFRLRDRSGGVARSHGANHAGAALTSRPGRPRANQAATSGPGFFRTAFPGGTWRAPASGMSSRHARRVIVAVCRTSRSGAAGRIGAAHRACLAPRPGRALESACGSGCLNSAPLGFLRPRSLHRSAFDHRRRVNNSMSGEYLLVRQITLYFSKNYLRMKQHAASGVGL